MGPLTGLRIIEIEGLGPAPFCGMLFADMGAEVISVTRQSGTSPVVGPGLISERGKKSLALNLKEPRAVEALLKLCENADALIEGFRPGVAERLGIGPETCMARNPKLVYGRMTGWGQNGPLAHSAGHDLNYISLSGALHAIGRQGEKPVPPLNLVGDYGGGGMFLAFGVMCALHEAARSGSGQVVDASMVEGSAVLMHCMYGMRASGMWQDARGANLLDGGAPFYDVYETKDGKYISIASLEPQFYDLLKRLAGLDERMFGNQMDATQWPAQKDKLTDIFKSKTRDEWCQILESTDVCFAPVLSMREAPEHPHNVERGTFIELEGVLQPGPAPRFTRTEPAVTRPAPRPGAHTDEVLQSIGYTGDDIRRLREEGAIVTGE